MTPSRLTSPVVLAFVATLSLGACRGGAPDERHTSETEHGGEEHVEGRVELPAEAVKMAAIKTALVTTEPVQESVQATAVITPNEYRLAHVSPRIAGKAIEVLSGLGDEVKEGQVLAQLDSLELGEKKSAYLQSRSNLEVARRNFQREERLFRQQISSEKEYLDTKGEFERSDATHRAAREALRLVGLSDGQIDQITWDGRGHPLSHFPLLAPFAGTVIERHITIGELITPENTPFTVADLRTVWVLIAIYEKDLARVGTGVPARVSVDAYPGEAFTGQLTYLSRVVDPSTRSAEGRVEINNRDGRLRPGMFASATLALPAAPNARAVLAAPRDSVQQVRGKPVAFVEEAPGTYAMRELVLGPEAGARVEIRSGLSAGERVVTDGAFYLKSTVLKEEMVGHED
jgi:cobalt-zinc-cadmium efflux system membrane fusion protein